jgi:hypothetical protein
MRSNVYANGQLLATYANNKTYFALNDWLGTKRVVTNDDGTVAQMCMNLPFGDELMCSATDVNEQPSPARSTTRKQETTTSTPDITPTAPAGSCLPTQGGCSR